MGYRRGILTTGLALVLAACGQSGPQSPEAPPGASADAHQPEILGVVKVDFQHIGQADFSVNATVIGEGVESQTLARTGSVSFTQGTRGSFTGPDQARYLYGQLNVNNTGTARSNLILLGISTDLSGGSHTLGDTSLAAAARASGTTLTALEARKVLPIHRRDLVGGVVQVVNDQADFQAYREADITPTIANYMAATPYNGYAFPFGFVARSKTNANTRVVPVGTATGTVTLAFKYADANPNTTDDMSSFTWYGLLITDTENRATVDPFETDTVRACDAARALYGDTPAILATLRNVAPTNCGRPTTTTAQDVSTVRTSGTPTAPTTSSPVQDVPVVPVTPQIQLSSPVSAVGTASAFSVDDTGTSSVSWTFGDGFTATGSSVTHTFAQPGLYTTTVTVLYPDGRSVTAQQQVAVLKAMKDIPARRSISDSMTASFDAGDPLPGFEYAWTFGDGSTGLGSRIQHTYPQIGTYDFNLTVRDTRITGLSLAAQHLSAQSVPPGQVFQDGSWVTVWRRAPVAVLSIDTPAGRLVPPSPIAAGNFPFTAIFDASKSTDTNLPTPSVLNYDWDFGDGTPKVLNGGAMPSHQYTTEGRFLVTLTVTNSFGLQDKYRNFVYSHDIRANIKMNTAYEAAGVQSLSVDPPDSLGTQSLKPQGVVQTVLDYFPYVLHKSYSFKGGIGYSLNTAGNKITSFCTSMEAYANGGVSLYSTKLTAPVDDGSGTFCNGLLLSSGAFKFPAASINELLISNDSYLNAMRASVFAGLVVPRINIAVYPDEFLPGDQASPIVTTNTYLNPLTGKTEWIMSVRIRESEMASSFANGAKLNFKVPVLAVDATGKLMTTVNGRFKSAFASPGFTSDCGDCTMVNGSSNITITMPVNSFTLSQGALDFSAIQLGNDSATRCGVDGVSSIYVKYGVNGCVLIGTSNVYPTSNAPLLDPFKYPIGDPTTFFGHIVFGATADSVRAFREYASVGVYSDLKDFTLGFIPFVGSSKGFMDAVKAYQAQGPSIGSVANVFLAGAGVVADASPILGKALKPFFESLKVSKAGKASLAKALDAVVSESSSAGKSVDGVSADLQTVFGTVESVIATCGTTCSRDADLALDGLASKGINSKDSLHELEQGSKDALAGGRTVECVLGASGGSAAFETIAEINQYIIGVAPKFISALSTTVNTCTYSQFNTRISSKYPGKYSGISSSDLTAAKPHHIIPLNELGRCAAAGGTNNCDQLRAMLLTAGIDINSAINGVLLPHKQGLLTSFDVKFPNATAHANMHTKVYFQTLYDRLIPIEQARAAGTLTLDQFKLKLTGELEIVANELLAGTFQVR